MGIKVEDYGKFKASINFLKKEKNWNEMVWVAMNNVADDIRNDAENKLYQKWKKNTGEAGKSIKTVIKRQGNYTYISLSSDHPAMNFLHYGGKVKKVPAYTEDKGSRLFPYVQDWHSAAGYDKEDRAMKMAGAIYDNQPFTQGAFHMRNALREGLPDLESEIMRSYHRMKPK